MDHVDDKRFERLGVLIVDDNEHTVDLLREILRAFGVRTVDAAVDGKSALRFLKRRSVDLVICDWEMKPLDGLAFTKLVRGSPDSPNPFVPILMLTAHTEMDRVLMARDAGVNDFVAKPVSPALLLSRMRSALDNWGDFVKAGSRIAPNDGRDGSRHGIERRLGHFGEVPVIDADSESQPEAAPASKGQPSSSPRD